MKHVKLYEEFNFFGKKFEQFDDGEDEDIYGEDRPYKSWEDMAHERGYAIDEDDIDDVGDDECLIYVNDLCYYIIVPEDAVDELREKDLIFVGNDDNGLGYSMMDLTHNDNVVKIMDICDEYKE